jgi:hypothetical protein
MKKLVLALILLSLVLLGCKNKTSASNEQMILPVEMTYNTRMAYAQLCIDGIMYNFSIEPTLERSCINKETANAIRKYEKTKNKYLIVNSAKWGKYEFNNVKFYIDSRLTSEGYFNGYLGYDFFRTFFSVTLDYSTNRLIINDDVSEAESISYRKKDEIFTFKLSDKKIAFLPMLVPNMYADSLEGFPDIDLDLIINSPVPYSHSDYFTSFPQIFKGNDAIIGVDAMLNNTVTIDYKHKRLVFNKSVNTEPLPYRESGEKISTCETIKAKEKNTQTVMEFPLQKRDHGMYIDLIIDGKKESFLMDTGATANIILKEGIYKTKVKTNDCERFFKMYFPEVKIGKIDLFDFPLSMDDTRLGVNCDGLLGMEFFTSYPEFDYVQFDYQNGVLRFTNQKPDGQPLPIVVKNKRIFCFPTVQGKKYKAFLDSGWQNYSIFINNIDNNLFPEEIIHQFGSLYERFTSNYMYTDSLNLLFGDKTISIPCISMRDQEFTKLIPSVFSEYDAGKYDIHLSFSFFEKNRVTFDFKNSLMWID